MERTRLGPSGGYGGYLVEDYLAPEGARISELHVTSGWFVDSIRLVYTDASGESTPLAVVGGAGVHLHEHEDVFVLDADEYLIGISGKSGNYVDSICFHTNKRVSAAYGGGSGENAYEFMAPAGSQIVGFFGRADWYLDSIGVIVQERPAASVQPKKATKKAQAGKQEVAAPAAPAPKQPKKNAKKVAVAKAVAQADATPVTPTIDAPPVMDDLKIVEGIGPKIAELLITNDISTFAALAATSPAQLKEILSAAGRRFAVSDPATWPEQAALAAKGDTAALAALQETLKGGRKVS